MLYAQKLAEIDVLREENRQLKEIIAASYPLPQKWCLSARQRRGMLALLAADIIAWERLALAVYGSDYPVKSTINAFIFNLRKKMHPHGLLIKSVREFGYALDNRRFWAAHLIKNE